MRLLFYGPHPMWPYFLTYIHDLHIWPTFVTSICDSWDLPHWEFPVKVLCDLPWRTFGDNTLCTVSRLSALSPSGALSLPPIGKMLGHKSPWQQGRQTRGLAIGCGLVMWWMSDWGEDEWWEEQADDIRVTAGLITKPADQLVKRAEDKAFR